MAVAVALLILGGCSAPNTEADAVDEEVPVTEQFRDVAGAEEEYLKVTQAYVLPASETYPPAPFAGEPGSYQVGYGTLTGLEAWNCAWGREYLRYVGSDAEAAAVALDEYAAFMETESFLKYYDPVSVHPVFAKVVEDARLGDPSGIQSLVSTNCPAV
ncbi:hypothetical protein [Homoserinimonas hongtaonis]|uniref:hypothetical protein n=1 Tax=Homoserinimonas hongtaonis TaxID=2079791 RepID=UPI000D36C6C6|nr:hypothetical protein [Salinibacterium hongtaonis]AWB88977.1 hypothetical protein C2138_04965 [Salinibacterium hongtaonis]